jgi:putative salt-induced outer membrane protein YdiY
MAACSPHHPIAQEFKTMPFDRRWPLACLFAAVPGIALAQAQATVKRDGQYRYAFSAGTSYASGNTDASSITLSGDGVRATEGDKWQFGGKANWADSDGSRTAENLTLGTQYDNDITPVWFGFGKAGYLRDEFANLEGRGSLFGGVGYHVVKTDPLTFDLSAGLGYTYDRYVGPTEVEGEQRTQYGRAEGLLAEESNHKWWSTTTFHQKLSVFPSLRSNAFRTEFDAGLTVAMSETLALTVGLSHRYNSDPGNGFERNDTLFVTGITVKLD